MRPRPIPALLCALALLAGCAAPPAAPSAPLPTPSPTPSPPLETPEPALPAETAAPLPLQVPDGLDGYARAYAELIVETEAEGYELKYDLVYLDEDGVPELVVGHPGYSVSVYQYDGGTLYPVMDHWGYGAMGNHGYEYLPGGNVIRNYNADLAGAIMYVWYGRLGASREVESYYDEPLSMWLFRDLNGNYQMDEDEPYSDERFYYYGDKEITPEEFDTYLIPGDYQELVGSQSAACLLAQLQAQAQKAAWGLEGQEPYYAYRDEDGNLQMELYFDPASGTGRGFRYQFGTDDWGRPPACDSFTFDGVVEGTWEGRPPDSVLSVDGDDGSDMVEDYQAAYEYDDAGRPVRFRSWGVSELRPTDIIRVEFYYRGDGTLDYKKYWHDGLLFSTTLSSLVTHYDREERPVYLRGYITHGHLEFYPIYGGGAAPEYCLLLDYSPSAYPVMYRLG